MYCTITVVDRVHSLVQYLTSGCKASSLDRTMRANSLPSTVGDRDVKDPLSSVEGASASVSSAVSVRPMAKLGSGLAQTLKSDAAVGTVERCGYGISTILVALQLKTLTCFGLVARALLVACWSITVKILQEAEIGEGHTHA